MRMRLADRLCRMQYGWDADSLARACMLVIGRKVLHAARAANWKYAQFRFSARNLALNDAPVRIRIGRADIRLVARGAVAADLWSGLRHERHELELVLKLVQPDTCFVDAGANAGLFSLVVAATFPSVRVYAFEPASDTFELLCRNIAANHLTNITPVRAALAEHAGTARLNLNAPGRDGLNTLGTPNHPDSNIVGNEVVEVITLDEFSAANRLGPISALKVDVEGAELFIFRGGRNLLDADQAPAILYEGYSWCTRGFAYHPVEIMWYLESLGYLLSMFDSESGKLRAARRADHYDTMMVAIKPGHPSFAMVGE